MLRKADLRDIAELRIQYFCEYRYFLRMKYGNSSSIASVRGEWLHSKLGDRLSSTQMKQNSLIIVIILSTLLLVLFLFAYW